MAEGVTTAKPEALQSREEAEVEHRPEMPAARGPDRGHVLTSWPWREGPHRWHAQALLAAARGPTEGVRRRHAWLP